MGKNNYVRIDLPKIENICFVLMPFSEDFNNIYENVIKKTTIGLKMECLRADEIFKPNVIMKDIWDSIRKAKFVIADISTKNPNVLYELGLCHALGKQVIILTRDKLGVPFDVNLIKYIFYDLNYPFWGQKLIEDLKNYISACEHSSFEYNGIFDGISIKIFDSYKQPIDTSDFNGYWIGNAVGEDEGLIYHMSINTKSNECINYLAVNKDELGGKMKFKIESNESYVILTETEKGEKIFDFFEDWEPDIFELQKMNDLLIGRNRISKALFVFRRQSESEFLRISQKWDMQK